MNRLTHARANGIKTGYWSPAKKEELVQRLAAYEDTGLEPEEIETMRDVGADTNKEIIGRAEGIVNDYEGQGLSPEDLSVLSAALGITRIIYRRWSR